ncbi:hypothetical protein [Bradyrhizobium valentinum]|uniref:hypothetical protein n=1 Tax=Bradyrhizobium valentinum TaxID=1518501 RepID=UPI000708EEAD|nr:hypothetical protein [Bradyrhizobium valentinum]KRQ95358.1 hypothetical protein CQ10_32970 [Bradyrhizobium valentinum]
MTGSVARSTLRVSKPGLNYDFAPPLDFSADETYQLITRRAVAGDHAELDYLLRTTAANELARPITVGLVAAIAIVSLWTPSAHAEIAARWFSLPNFLFFAPVPMLVLLATWMLLRFP